VGNGSNVKLWHDMQCVDAAIKEVIPVFFGIARAKDALIEAHMEISGGAIQWNMSFARVAQDWEVDVFASFYMFYLVRMRQEGEDR
jgi:hypothetical protein